MGYGPDHRPTTTTTVSICISSLLGFVAGKLSDRHTVLYCEVPHAILVALLERDVEAVNSVFFGCHVFVA